MTGYKSAIRDALLKSRPELDVRIDQCDIVRVTLGKLFVGIERIDGRFSAEISRFDEQDAVDLFGEVTLAKTTRSTIEEIVEAVLGWLEKESATDSPL